MEQSSGIELEDKGHYFYMREALKMVRMMKEIRDECSAADSNRQSSPSARTKPPLAVSLSTTKRL